MQKKIADAASGGMMLSPKKQNGNPGLIATTASE
jgi:hypothetical protein